MALPAAAVGAIGGSAISSAGNILNGSNTTSNGWGLGISDSAYGNSSWNSGWNESVSRLYGSEASAADYLRAAEANNLQDAYLLKQMAYNSAEAQKQREWQEYMSNTAYQRAVLDLKAAGLNPILAAGNYGASTPSGAYATSGLQSSHKANTFANQESFGSGGSAGGSSGGGWSHGEEGYGNESITRTQLASMIEGIGKIFQGSGDIVASGYNNSGSASGKLRGNNSPSKQGTSKQIDKGYKASLSELTAGVKEIHK